MRIAPAVLSSAVPAITPLRLAARPLGHLAGGLLLLTMLAGAYTLKRHLRIDLVPGVDMLPDERIEAAIQAAVAPVAWTLRIGGLMP